MSEPEKARGRQTHPCLILAGILAALFGGMITLAMIAAPGMSSVDRHMNAFKATFARTFRQADGTVAIVVSFTNTYPKPLGKVDLTQAIVTVTENGQSVRRSARLVEHGDLLAPHDEVAVTFETEALPAGEEPTSLQFWIWYSGPGLLGAQGSAVASVNLPGTSPAPAGTGATSPSPGGPSGH